MDKGRLLRSMYTLLLLDIHWHTLHHPVISVLVHAGRRLSTGELLLHGATLSWHDAIIRNCYLTDPRTSYLERSACMSWSSSSPRLPRPTVLHLTRSPLLQNEPPCLLATIIPPLLSMTSTCARCRISQRASLHPFLKQGVDAVCQFLRCKPQSIGHGVIAFSVVCRAASASCTDVGLLARQL